ncbi:DUF3789 domain-containing protein [Enterococcus sp. AZ196]
MFWITLAFILGLFIGTTIGVSIMAVLTAGKRVER